MKRALAALFSVAIMAFSMAGCSTMQVVDSDVTAFSHWSAAPPGPGTAYRFERLPSQQVGMELNPAVARYSGQVVVNTLVVERVPYDGVGYDGFGFPAPGVFLGGGSRGAAVGMSFPMRFSEPYFKRDLSILMRDLSSNQVVFETRALHDGVSSNTLAVLSAMLDAALRGFPQPPPGTRRINVETPR
jgi:predicted small secreted protein